MSLIDKLERTKEEVLQSKIVELFLGLEDDQDVDVFERDALYKMSKDIYIHEVYNLY